MKFTLLFWTDCVFVVTLRGISVCTLRVDRRRMQRHDNELILRAKKLT